MANPLARFAPSKAATSTVPLAPFMLPALPDKLRRIDPEGCAEWEQAVQSSVGESMRRLEDKLNVVIDAQKTGA